MLNEFIDYLFDEANNGSIYVLGAQGQTGKEITEKWILTREHGDEKQAQRDIRLWKKRIAEGYGDTLKAFDCSGLGMFFLQNKKGLYADKNANGMFAVCDEINREDVRKGDWVFKVTDGRATHIGFAVSEDTAIEARGRDYGVVVTQIDERDWNAYGRPKIFKDEIEAGGDFVSHELKKGDKGAEVASLQYALMSRGYSLPKYGNDGSFGAETVNALRQMQKDRGLPDTGTAGQEECETLGLVWKGAQINYKELYLAASKQTSELLSQNAMLRDEVEIYSRCIAEIQKALAQIESA